MGPQSEQWVDSQIDGSKSDRRVDSQKTGPQSEQWVDSQIGGSKSDRRVRVHNQAKWIA